MQYKLNTGAFFCKLRGFIICLGIFVLCLFFWCFVVDTSAKFPAADVIVFKTEVPESVKGQLTLYGHIKTAEQRTIMQQYGDCYTGRR